MPSPTPVTGLLSLVGAFLLVALEGCSGSAPTSATTSPTAAEANNTIPTPSPEEVSETRTPPSRWVQVASCPREPEGNGATEDGSTSPSARSTQDPHFDLAPYLEEEGHVPLATDTVYEIVIDGPTIAVALGDLASIFVRQEAPEGEAGWAHLQDLAIRATRVALRGDLLIAGAPSDYDDNQEGWVGVYHRGVDGRFQKIQEIRDGDAGPFFGEGVFLHGEHLAIVDSMAHNNHRGRINLYELTDGSGSPAQWQRITSVALPLVACQIGQSRGGAWIGDTLHLSGTHCDRWTPLPPIRLLPQPEWHVDAPGSEVNLRTLTVGSDDPGDAPTARFLAPVGDTPLLVNRSRIRTHQQDFRLRDWSHFGSEGLDHTHDALLVSGRSMDTSVPAHRRETTLLLFAHDPPQVVGRFTPEFDFTLIGMNEERLAYRNRRHRRLDILRVREGCDLGQKI